MQAVRGKDLAEDEEGRHCFVFEHNVVTAEGPAVVAGIEVIAEGQDAPGQGVVNGTRRCGSKR